MKNIILRCVLIVVAAAMLLCNFTELLTAQKSDNVAKEVFSNQTDVLKLHELASVPLSEIEKEIEEVELRLIQAKLPPEPEPEPTLEELLASGEVTYRGLMEDVLIVGDSLMHGLTIRNILDSGNMITQASATLYHLSLHKKTIIARKPKFLILHYGLNMMVNSQKQLDWFIGMYRKLMAELKEKIPDTEIYISSIFNVSEKAAKKFPCVSRYNEQIKKMCDDLSLNYLDNSSLLPDDGSFYSKDGIHAKAKFYTEKWLPFVCQELELLKYRR